MPEFGPGGRKGPFDVLEGETGLDVRIPGDINRIIDDNKLMTEYLPIDQHG